VAHAPRGGMKRLEQKRALEFFRAELACAAVGFSYRRAAGRSARS